MIRAPAGSTVTISPFLSPSAGRVWARKAGIAEATKVSSSPSPTISGHSWRAATSVGMLGVHGDERVVAAHLGEGGADRLGQVAS